MPRKNKSRAGVFALAGKRFHVTSTAPNGVVGPDTAFDFFQEGELVWARYAGGAVRLGFLAGLMSGAELVFSYGQVHADGSQGSGRSTARLERLANGRLRITERFTWAAGEGVNVFDEIA